jgi:NADH dehydrogenase/NADH:ubiquinone oxidoreductase subunit G
MVSQAHLDAFDLVDRVTQDGGQFKCTKGTPCNGRCLPKGHKCRGLKSGADLTERDRVKRNIGKALIGGGAAATAIGAVAAASHFSRKMSSNDPVGPKESKPATAKAAKSIAAEESSGSAAEESGESTAEESGESKRVRITASPRARKSLELEAKGKRKTQSKRVAAMVGKLQKNKAEARHEPKFLPRLETRAASESDVQESAKKNRGQATTGTVTIVPGSGGSSDQYSRPVMQKEGVPLSPTTKLPGSKQIVIASKPTPLTQQIGPALAEEGKKVITTMKKTAAEAKAGYKEGPATDIFKKAGKTLGGFVGEQLKKSKIAIRRTKE